MRRVPVYSEFDKNSTGSHALLPQRGAADQWLRAFRRAEIVFDAVLFGNCVVGAAVAMAVASIFRFEFWFVWCVVLATFLGAFWMPLWVLRASLGVLWGSFGAPLADFWGSLDALGLLWGALGAVWGSNGAPGTSLGASGPISGIFREIPGGLLAPF